jgi:hypothetical protein
MVYALFASLVLITPCQNYLFILDRMIRFTLILFIAARLNLGML